MLKYRKASFPKSVSSTFVAHCSPAARIRFNERVVLITLPKETWTVLPLKGFSAPDSAFAKKRKDMKRNMAYNHYWRRQKLTPRNAKRVIHVLERMLRENTKLGY